MKLKNRQKGVVLIVSLLILLVLTILALTTTNTSTTDTRIAYNMQVQKEAEALAQQAIDQVLSSNLNFNYDIYDITTLPTAPVAATSIDNKSYDVALAWPPTCLGVRFGEAAGTSCQKGAMSGDMEIPCRATDWEVVVQVTDPATNVRVAFHQGVKVYIPFTGPAPTSCQP